ncbi:bifunctional Hexapeptide repeat/Armadillo-type fold/Nucleotide-diphospho-sugar transferases/Trimeric LpxA-like superfamily [Babesia duncani]|uniref:Bifunctional Hexapeptide repeat/Armadillo-type fold/Nucleotide-diphospho-sugar transferases/Trimeric LpxA-like superfamily n=1 Tax=Babesia duncani TaxID=323732 RepID=A0AAD9PLN3_9APIC|nr:bifunctional Hexapeptide repeat/Armadillo-type fold/Nucleotide-diphospho-sugar transferases/Trimeric LpxA-like superfamily [Babesia duncani]
MSYSRHQDDIVLSKEFMARFKRPSCMELRFDLCLTHIYICTQRVVDYFTEWFDKSTMYDYIQESLTQEIKMNEIYTSILENDISFNNFPAAIKISNPRLYYAVYMEYIARFSENVECDSGQRRESEGSQYGPRIREGCKFMNGGAFAQPFYSHDTSNITKSIMGKNCHVGEDTTIQDSIIFDNVTVGTGCNISRSIIMNNVTILNGTAIPQGSIIGSYCTVGPEFATKFPGPWRCATFDSKFIDLTLSESDERSEEEEYEENQKYEDDEEEYDDEEAVDPAHAVELADEPEPVEPVETGEAVECEEYEGEDEAYEEEEEGEEYDEDDEAYEEEEEGEEYDEDDEAYEEEEYEENVEDELVLENAGTNDNEGDDFIVFEDSGAGEEEAVDPAHAVELADEPEPVEPVETGEAVECEEYEEEEEGEEYDEGEDEEYEEEEYDEDDEAYEEEEYEENVEDELVLENAGTNDNEGDDFIVFEDSGAGEEEAVDPAHAVELADEPEPVEPVETGEAVECEEYEEGEEGEEYEEDDLEYKGDVDYVIVPKVEKISARRSENLTAPSSIAINRDKTGPLTYVWDMKPFLESYKLHIINERFFDAIIIKGPELSDYTDDTDDFEEDSSELDFSDTDTIDDDGHISEIVSVEIGQMAVECLENPVYLNDKMLEIRSLKISYNLNEGPVMLVCLRYGLQWIVDKFDILEDDEDCTELQEIMDECRLCDMLASFRIGDDFDECSLYQEVFDTIVTTSHKSLSYLCRIYEALYHCDVMCFDGFYKWVIQSGIQDERIRCFAEWIEGE